MVRADLVRRATTHRVVRLVDAPGSPYAALTLPFRLSVTRVCTACPDRFAITCQDFSGASTSCQVGFFVLQGSFCVTICPPLHFADPVTSSCLFCPTIFLGSLECTSNGPTTCQPGLHLIGNECRPCPFGTQGPTYYNPDSEPLLYLSSLSACVGGLDVIAERRANLFLLAARACEVPSQGPVPFSRVADYTNSLTNIFFDQTGYTEPACVAKCRKSAVLLPIFIVDSSHSTGMGGLFAAYHEPATLRCVCGQNIVIAPQPTPIDPPNGAATVHLLPCAVLKDWGMWDCKSRSRSGLLFSSTPLPAAHSGSGSTAASALRR